MGCDAETSNRYDGELVALRFVDARMDGLASALAAGAAMNRSCRGASQYWLMQWLLRSNGATGNTVVVSEIQLQAFGAAQAMTPNQRVERTPGKQGVSSVALLAGAAHARR